MFKVLFCVTAILLLATQTATSRTVSDGNKSAGTKVAFAPADPDFWKGKKKLQKKKYLKSKKKLTRELKAKRQAEYRKKLKARQRAALRRLEAKPIKTVSVGPIVQVIAPVPVSDIPIIGQIFDVFREFLEKTPVKGYTMQRQGFDVAFGYLHPLFRERLAKAIWQAQGEGFDKIGVFSAYRKPNLGVGGFGNKHMSCHDYGLAVDMAGIGRPGSKQTIRWHEIAKENGVYCPYGPHNGAEWNHCQLVPHKVCGSYAALRKTITANGPKDPEDMWKAVATLPPIKVCVASRNGRRS